VQRGTEAGSLNKITVTAPDKFTATYTIKSMSGTFPAECVDTAAGKGSLLLELPYEKSATVRTAFNPVPWTETLSASARFDAVVRAHIARALAGAAHHKSQTERLYYAWQLLKMERGTFPGMSTDLPLAAAEHNLFARYAVCSGRHSAAEMWLAAKGYEWNKRLGETIDSAKDALGVTRSVPEVPPSHSSEDVQRWGENGAFEGEWDRKKD
jgi:hypothetical protein